VYRSYDGSISHRGVATFACRKWGDCSLITVLLDFTQQMVSFYMNGVLQASVDVSQRLGKLLVGVCTYGSTEVTVSNQYRNPADLGLDKYSEIYNQKL